MIANERGTGPSVVLEPNRLWSLYDMLRFYAGSFVTLMRDLQLVASVMGEQINLGNGGARLSAEHRQSALIAVRNVAQEVRPLPMSRLIQINLDELARRLVDDEGMTYERGALRIKLMHDDIVKDLASGAYFLMLDMEEAHLYHQPEGAPFGKLVAKQFPDATYDIDHSAKCLALGEPTACVFHLMCASEHALRVLARRLGITGVLIKSWEKVLTDVDRKLVQLASPPKGKSPRLDRKLRYYTEARNDLSGFKNAWRNHVMHAKVQYNTGEAREIYNSVQSFMQRLAAGPPR